MKLLSWYRQQLLPALAYTAGVKQTARRQRLSRIFVVISLVILLLTTIYWATLSAKIHQHNADQLIDAYMFENVRTFHNAMFPGSHTFLLKWPMFALMAAFGNTVSVFEIVTVSCVLITIGVLVWVLHKIEPRPAVFSLLCLGLASMLLLVPAQPSAGTLLPVNMAMTTTRNLEYAVFIIALCLMVRAARLRSWQAGLAFGLIIVVIASDKLFAPLVIGSCGFAALCSLLPWHDRSRATYWFKWLLAAVGGFVVAIGLLGFINRAGVSQIVNGGAASPYSLVVSAKQLAIATVFTTGAVLTNFGANPAYNIVVTSQIPQALISRILRPTGIAYLVNIGLFIYGFYHVMKLLFSKRRHLKKPALIAADRSRQLSVLLLGASLAALIVYVLTNHYYPVDSRYLTICVFAVVVSAASSMRLQMFRPRLILVASLVMVVVLPIGMFVVWQQFSASQSAGALRSGLTTRLAAQLDSRHISRIDGNYWDITPAKAITKYPLTIAPIENCSQPRPILNSTAWFDQPLKQPGGLLLIRDGTSIAGPDYPHASTDHILTYGGCSLQRIVGIYGTPSERVPLDSGTSRSGLSNALLLIYPDGVKPVDHVTAQPPITATGTSDDQPIAAPISKDTPFVGLPSRADCTAGTTTQIIAHEDDDILFMTPDMFKAVDTKRCIRTVYLTAGNAGEAAAYWSGRELGAKAAYAKMYGVANTWREEIQAVGDKKLAVEYLQDVPEVSLVFMRLPDGNLRGQGFVGNEFQSLHKLLHYDISSIRAVDDSTRYTQTELINTLAAIMAADKTNEIRTLGSPNPGDGDHADHHDAGILADAAAAAYQPVHTVTHYLGYPIRDLPVNLGSDDLTRKMAVFLTYASHDGAVCQTVQECQSLKVSYGSYLSRQYQPNATATP